MTTMPLPPPTGDPRCPSCGALTPLGESGRPAQWCSLCHAPLHAVPVAETVAEPVAEAVAAPVAESANEPIVAPTGGDVDPVVVAQMLEELRTDDDPWVRRASGLTRGRQVALGVGVALAIIVVATIVAFIVGVLLP